MKKILIFVFVVFSFIAQGQNIEGKLFGGGSYGSDPNSDLAVTLKATSQYPTNSASSPTIFVIRIEQSEWDASGVTSVSIVDNPLDMGDNLAPDAEWDDGNGYHYIYYSAGVADWDLSDCPISLGPNSTYLSLKFNDMTNAFTVELTLKDVDPVVGSEVNLVDVNQLILTNDYILPLELIIFTADIYKSYSSLLKWETINEINVDKIVVQRSLATKKWEDIGFVLANNIKNKVNFYKFIDKDVYDGYGERTYFYRLKFIDKDSQYKYSSIQDVIFINEEQNIEIEVFPNPSSEVVYYKLSGIRRNSNIDVLVYDLAGNLVFQRKSKYNTTRNLLVDKKSFKFDNGIYNLIIIDEDNKKHYSNFVMTR